MSYLLDNSLKLHHGLVISEELPADLESLLTNEFVNDLSRDSANAEDLVRSNLSIGVVTL